MRWIVETATEIGGRREQQDRVIALQSRWRRENMIALADGMGGHSNGAAAAQLVIDSARDLFATARRYRSPSEFLDQLCEVAHERIRGLGASARAAARPGSTCVFLYLRPGEAYWLHMGDSRLYHFRGTQLLMQTSDHSVKHLLSDQDRKKTGIDSLSPRALYAYLGSEFDPVLDSDQCAVTADDWFLLCSDGFWNTVSTDEIVQTVVGDSPRVGTAASGLAQIAARRGGPSGDNISLALVRCPTFRICSPISSI